MATIAYTRLYQDFWGVQIFGWMDMAKGDVGQGLALPRLADKTVQFLGTFDSATATLKGACHPTDPTYATLNDADDGAALSFTAAGIKQVLENPYLIPAAVDRKSTRLNSTH